MNQQVYSQEIIEFVTVSVEYCSLIERVGETERKDFLLKLARILPLLYIKATLLPETANDECDNLETYVTEEQYEYLREKMTQMMGEADDYLEVFEADMAYSEAPLAASISEGLADIYQDIRDLLEIYRQGNEPLSQAAISRCRNSFVSYWGQKLVNVMRPIHAVCFANTDEQENEYTASRQHCDDEACDSHLL